jgi:uncharacterized protein (TIGR02186 family)
VALRLLLLLLAFAAPAAAQESVVTGLSTDSIGLNATFDGSDLFVFGAIRREGPPPTDTGPLNVIITLKGPPREVTVRRKERRFGIWINIDSVEVRQAPSFYAVATTFPLDQILSQTEQLRYGIGMDQAVRRVGGSATLADTTPFTEALVRLKERTGSYVQADGAVKIAEETLFQTEITMPANLVEGDYATEFFLVRDNEVINHGETLIRVEKTGIERWLYNFSRDEPLYYGLMSLALALAAGWLAAAAFGLARR